MRIIKNGFKRKLNKFFIFECTFPLRTDPVPMIDNIWKDSKNRRFRKDFGNFPENKNEKKEVQLSSVMNIFWNLFLNLEYTIFFEKLIIGKANL